MTITLDLTAEIENSLRQAADLRHIPVEQYALSLLQSSLQSSVQSPSAPAQTPAEFSEWLRSLAFPPDQIPDYPETFWTRDVVSDDE